MSDTLEREAKKVENTLDNCWKESFSDFFEDILKLSDKRDKLCKNVKPCPSCNSDQVQLISWVDTIEWKCRRCDYKWEINE